MAHDDWVLFISVPVAAITIAGNVQAAQYMTLKQAQHLMFGKSAEFERNDIKFSLWDQPPKFELDRPTIQNVIAIDDGRTG